MDARASACAPEVAVIDRDRLVAIATRHATTAPEIADALDELRKHASALADSADAFERRRRRILPRPRLFVGSVALALNAELAFLLISRHDYSARSAITAAVFELFIFVAFSRGLLTRHAKDKAAEMPLRRDRALTDVATVRLARAVTKIETWPPSTAIAVPIGALRRSRPRERRSAARRAAGERAGSDPGDPEPPSPSAGDAR